MVDIQSTLRYDADLTSVMAQVKALTSQINTLNLSFNALDAAAQRTKMAMAQAFAGNVGSMGSYTNKMIQMKTAAESFGEAIQKNRLTMSQYFREAANGLIRQDSLLKQYARQQVRYQESIGMAMGAGAGGKPTAMILTPKDIDMRNAATRMRLLNQEFNIFRTLVNQGASEMINFGKNTQWTGRQLTVGLTMPVVLFGAAFAKTFMSIDKELTRFAKVYGEDLVNNNARATQKMKEQIMDLAKTISSTMGVAASETAALAADVAATGQTGQNLLDTVAQTTRLAVLGEVDRQEAMKATLAIQTAFRQNTDELADSINFLNAIENQTSTTLNDLVEAIPKAGPVVKGLGGTIKDLSVLMVAMKEGGIPAAEAANAIKSGMASLINPTKKASDVAKQFGVDLQGIVKANRGELMPTLTAVQESLNGLDDFSRSRIIEEIFGKYQFARISALFNNLGQAGSQTQKAMELAGASTADLAEVANRELRTYTESTTVRFKRMVESLKNQLVPLGEALLEGLMPIMKGIGGIVEAVGNFFNNIPDQGKGFLKFVGAIGLLAGPALMLIGLFKQLVGNGIKAAMAIVTLGARLAGIKVGPLQHLDAEAASANIQIEGLNNTFLTQEQIVSRLRKELELYRDSLRKLASTNPQMFTPPVGGRGMPIVPIRRAGGGDVPGGYGGGDKVPALLESGEFVVRKESVSKYRPILDAMNSGTLKGFTEGTPRLGPLHAAHTTLPFSPKTMQYGTAMSYLSGLSGGNAYITFAKEFPNSIKILSKSVALLPEKLNMQLRSGSASISGFKSGYQSVGPMKYAATASEGGFDLAQKGAAAALKKFDKAVMDETIRLANNTKEKKVTDEMLARAQKTVIADMQKLGGAEKELATVMKQQSQRLGSVRISTTAEMLKDSRFHVKNGNIFFSDKGSTAMVGSYGDGRYRDVRKSIPLGFSGGLTPEQATERNLKPAKQLGFPSGVSTFGTFAPSVAGMKAGYIRTGNAIKIIQREASRVVGTTMETLVTEFLKAVKDTLQSKSPSKRAQKDQAVEGKNFADGAIIGFQQGMSKIKQLAAAASLEEAQGMATAMISGIEKGLSAIKQKRAIITTSMQQTVQQMTDLERQKIGISNTGPNSAKLIQDLDKKILELKKQIEADERKLVGLKKTENKLSQDKIIIEQQIVQLTEAERVEAAIAVATPNQIPPVDPNVSPRDGKPPRSPSGGMNALFGVSMLTSTMTMFMDSTSGATDALSKFSMALMGISSLMMLMPNGIRGVGGERGILGLKDLGGKISSAGTARVTAGKFGGSMLKGIGSVVAGLGGPYGLAAAAVIVGVTAAVIQYNKSLEEARERAISAFKDPLKTAEFYGKTITSITDQIKQNIFEYNAAREELSQTDPALREAVKQDYSSLIEVVKGSSMEGGAHNLAMAFNKMLASGLSAKEARAAVQAIAEEAGTKGAMAFGLALKNKMLQRMSSADLVQSIMRQFSPLQFQKSSIPSERKAGQPESLIEIFKKQNEDLDALTKDIEGFAGMKTLIPKNFNDALQLLFSPEPSARIMASFGLLPDWFPAAQDTKMLQDMNEQLDQAQVNLLKISDIDSTQLVEFSKEMFALFDEAPQAAQIAFERLQKDAIALPGVDFDPEPVKKMLTEIGGVFGSTLNRMIDAAGPAAETLSYEIMNAIAAGLTPQEIVDALSVGGIPELEFKVKLVVDLKTAIVQLNSAKQLLKDFVEKDMQESLLLGQRKLQNLLDYREEYVKIREAQKERLQTVFEEEQKAIEDEINTLEKQADVIEKTTNKYLKSVRDRANVDNFYANQRKSNVSALGKLAAGDVFGFLTEKYAMAQEGISYSYEEEIKKIEERRDAQTEAIQDEIDKKQELMDENEKAHERQLELFDIETKARADELRIRIADQKRHNGEMKGLISSISSDEIMSAAQVTKQFGIELGNRYEELVRSQGKSMIATLQAQINLEQITKSEAYVKISDFYKAVSDKPLIGMNPYAPFAEMFQYFGSKDFIDSPPSPSAQSAPPSRKDFGDRFASGGYVSGPGSGTSDSIPANLSNGEYVVRASSVSKYGKDFMDGINKQAYATGGMVRKYGVGGIAERAYYPQFATRMKNSDQPNIGDVKSYRDPSNNGNKNNLTAHQKHMMHLSNMKNNNDDVTYTNAIYKPKSGDINPKRLGSLIEKWVGNKARFYSGWEGHGSWPSGGPFGVLMHHTANRVGQGQVDAMKNGYIWQGQFVSGPIVQSVITADGGTHIIGYGDRGTGAGTGTTQYMPDDLKEMADVINRVGINSSAFQIEVDSDGQEKDFTIEQFDSIGKLTAAIREFSGWSSFSGHIINHKDWAVGRKNDTLYDRSVFTSNAEAKWKMGPGISPYAGALAVRANGGAIYGPGTSSSDSIPALVSNGEYIIRANSVGKYGKSMMDSINAGTFSIGGMVGNARMPKYALGGMVGNRFPMSSSNTDTGSVYNIEINANGIQNPEYFANKVINIIERSNSRIEHSRVVTV